MSLRISTAALAAFLSSLVLSAGGCGGGGGVGEERRADTRDAQSGGDGGAVVRDVVRDSAHDALGAPDHTLSDTARPDVVPPDVAGPARDAGAWLDPTLGCGQAHRLLGRWLGRYESEIDGDSAGTITLELDTLDAERCVLQGTAALVVYPGGLSLDAEVKAAAAGDRMAFRLSSAGLEYHFEGTLDLVQLSGTYRSHSSVMDDRGVWSLGWSCPCTDGPCCRDCERVLAGQQGGCEAGEVCSLSGDCVVSPCEPDCSAVACGPDPVCAFPCGECAQDETCRDGACVPACVPSCGDEPCAEDGCGGYCDGCPTPAAGPWVGDGLRFVVRPEDSAVRGAELMRSWESVCEPGTMHSLRAFFSRSSYDAGGRFTLVDDDHALTGRFLSEREARVTGVVQQPMPECDETTSADLDITLRALDDLCAPGSVELALADGVPEELWLDDRVEVELTLAPLFADFCDGPVADGIPIDLTLEGPGAEGCTLEAPRVETRDGRAVAAFRVGPAAGEVRLLATVQHLETQPVGEVVVQTRGDPCALREIRMSRFGGPSLAPDGRLSVDVRALILYRDGYRCEQGDSGEWDLCFFATGSGGARGVMEPEVVTVPRAGWEAWSAVRTARDSATGLITIHAERCDGTGAVSSGTVAVGVSRRMRTFSDLAGARKPVVHGEYLYTPVGLGYFDVRSSDNLLAESTLVPVANVSNGLVMDGDVGLGIDSYGAVTVIDLTDPAVPTPIETLTLAHPVQYAAVRGGRGYLQMGGRIVTVDLTSPAEPRVLNDIVDAYSSEPGALAVSDAGLYSLFRGHFLQPYALDDFGPHIPTDSLAFPSEHVHLVADGRYVFVGAEYRAPEDEVGPDADSPVEPDLIVLHSEGVRDLGEVQVFTGPGFRDLHVRDGVLFMLRDDELELLHMEAPGTPRILERWPVGPGARYVTASETRAFVSTEEGVEVYQLASGSLPTCGNGVREGSEACDGSVREGVSCESLGRGPGVLGCAEDCTFDTSGCRCGDGIIDPGEKCDGTTLPADGLAAVGAEAGRLGCDASCQLDTSACVFCVDDEYEPNGTRGLAPVVGAGVFAGRLCPRTHAGSEFYYAGMVTDRDWFSFVARRGETVGVEVRHSSGAASPGVELSGTYPSPDDYAERLTERGVIRARFEAASHGEYAVGLRASGTEPVSYELAIAFAPACVFDADCGEPGEVCQEFECRRAQCETDADCPQHLSCDAATGLCEVCVEDADCPLAPAQRCLQNACVCSDDEDAWLDGVAAVVPGGEGVTPGARTHCGDQTSGPLQVEVPAGRRVVLQVAPEGEDWVELSLLRRVLGDAWDIWESAPSYVPRRYVLAAPGSEPARYELRATHPAGEDARFQLTVLAGEAEAIECREHMDCPEEYFCVEFLCQRTPCRYPMECPVGLECFDWNGVCQECENCEDGKWFGWGEVQYSFPYSFEAGSSVTLPAESARYPSFYLMRNLPREVREHWFHTELPGGEGLRVEALPDRTSLSAELTLLALDEGSDAAVQTVIDGAIELEATEKRRDLFIRVREPSTQFSYAAGRVEYDLTVTFTGCESAADCRGDGRECDGGVCEPEWGDIPSSAP